MAEKTARRANLNEPTLAELLWLWRRSRGLSQRRAAKRYGLDRMAYQRMEHGVEAISPPRLLALVNDHVVTTAELLRLARRRSGRSLRQVASLQGVSHVTYLRAEAAGNVAARDFWRSEGYRF